MFAFFVFSFMLAKDLQDFCSLNVGPSKSTSMKIATIYLHLLSILKLIALFFFCEKKFTSLGQISFLNNKFCVAIIWCLDSIYYNYHIMLCYTVYIVLCCGICLFFFCFSLILKFLQCMFLKSIRKIRNQAGVCPWEKYIQA